MLFNSLEFFVFFPIVVFLYLVLPARIRYIWLLIASYYFYMSWNPVYALLMAFSTAVTYLSGIGMEGAERRWGERAVVWKKRIVAVSFFVNIGILFLFKYAEFLLQNVNWILGKLHLLALPESLNLLLPVGISFYTFQALSYTMDVYRGQVKVERNFLRYALFVSFFPQLVAGPIERSSHLLSQVNTVPQGKLWDYDRIANGCILMVWGFFQKMVIADRVAVLVNSVFDSYYLYGTVILAAGAAGFALQIYCDFSSYSMIAIGAARVMGFELMENFNVPYFSRSIQEFWRRWHISLSTWFRDYLYIPLGGSRCSKAKAYRNTMITFLVSGLWHGANWTYLAWGGLHGFYQMIGKALRPWKERMNQKLHTKTQSISYKLGQALITFVLVDLAWIFFRADTLKDAVYYIWRMFTRADFWTLSDGSLYMLGLNRFEMNILYVSTGVLFLVDLIRYKKGQQPDEFLAEQCIWFRWLAVLGMILATLIFGVYGPAFDAQQFIYFQF